MIRRFALIVLATAFTRATLAGNCPAVPSTNIGSQPRTSIKHRKATAIQPQHATVTEVINWSQPDLSDPDIRRSEQTIDPHETKVYTIQGDVWLAKIEENDCDYHLEMSVRGGSETDQRIIVEIPVEQKAVRAALIKAMKASGQGDLTTKSKVDFKKPMPITVTGFGFIDGAHWSKLHPKVGNKHGDATVATLWELHPVFVAADPTAKH